MHDSHASHNNMPVEQHSQACIWAFVRWVQLLWVQRGDTTMYLWRGLVTSCAQDKHYIYVMLVPRSE